MTSRQSTTARLPRWGSRHRRRSVHAEAIAPWVTLSVILVMWWAGSKTLNWVRPTGPEIPFNAGVDRSVPKVSPVDRVEPEQAVAPPKTMPTLSANTMVLGSDMSDLRGRALLVPVRGLDAGDLVSSFHDARGSSRRHEAIDILAARGTDVVAVENGKIAKLFTSKAGGLTVYQFDPSEKYVYYYAHLDRYASGLKEGVAVRRGDVLGSVGTTGNAPENTPHLHFAISKLDLDKRWWGGTALDPYLVWRDPS
jgi:murein DD-endopeptidase MepM/ murein hydrolase activator NlpD